MQVDLSRRRTVFGSSSWSPRFTDVISIAIGQYYYVVSGIFSDRIYTAYYKQASPLRLSGPLRKIELFMDCSVHFKYVKIHWRPGLSAPDPSGGTYDAPQTS